MKLALPLLLVPLAITAGAVGTACVTSRPEPVTLPTAPPPGPWTVMREALLGCASDAGLHGPLHTQVTFDERGTVLSVSSGYGDAYAACVGNWIVRSRFHAERGRTLDIAFATP